MTASNGVAGSIGPGRLIVVQPAYTGEPGGLNVALGIQRFVTRRLKECGRETGLMLMAHSLAANADPDVPGSRAFFVFATWADLQLSDWFLRNTQSRWGLVPELTWHGPAVTMSTRLVEVRGAADVNMIARWTFEGSHVGLVHHVAELLEGVAVRVGGRSPWTRWQALFDTDVEAAALGYLEALGLFTVLDERCAVGPEAPLGSLLGVLAMAPRMTHAIALLPEIFRALARDGASEIELAGWLRRAREIAGWSPPAWTAVMRELFGGQTGDA